MSPFSRYPGEKVRMRASLNFRFWVVAIRKTALTPTLSRRTGRGKNTLFHACLSTACSYTSAMSDGVEKSFLVQKFARLGFGPLHIVGYSVAGEETVIQVPEMNVCFDIGRSPYFALTSDYVCISHSHMDHIAGLAYYLSQRAFQGMKPGTVLIPREMERSTDALLKCWRDLERQGTPYKLVPMSPRARCMKCGGILGSRLRHASWRPEPGIFADPHSRKTQTRIAGHAGT